MCLLPKTYEEIGLALTRWKVVFPGERWSRGGGVAGDAQGQKSDVVAEGRDASASKTGWVAGHGRAFPERCVLEVVGHFTWAQVDIDRKGVGLNILSAKLYIQFPFNQLDQRQ